MVPPNPAVLSSCDCSPASRGIARVRVVALSCTGRQILTLSVVLAVPLADTVQPCQREQYSRNEIGFARWRTSNTSNVSKLIISGPWKMPWRGSQRKIRKSSSSKKDRVIPTWVSISQVEEMYLDKGILRVAGLKATFQCCFWSSWF